MNVKIIRDRRSAWALRSGQVEAANELCKFLLFFIAIYAERLPGRRPQVDLIDNCPSTIRSAPEMTRHAVTKGWRLDSDACAFQIAS